MSENKQNHIKKVRDYKRSTITRPLSEMEVIDLMIYGDDVLISNKDNKNIFSDHTHVAPNPKSSIYSETISSLIMNCINHVICK